MKRDLEHIEIPGAHEARKRAWDVVRAAYLERERVTWPRRHARELALAGVAVAIVSAAVTPPGRSVVNSIRDAVGREKVVGISPAHRELVRLPSAGRLLVQSRRGAWVVQRNGSRRLLGPYRGASWSPQGKYLAAVLRTWELVALDPKGNVHWAKPRKQHLAFPRWSSDGYRIAYLADSTLRVITGDGLRDWLIGEADPKVAPAWRPGTHEVAYVGADGSLHVADADRQAEVPRRIQFNASKITSLQWSGDGKELLTLGEQDLIVTSADGSGTPTRTPGATYTAAAFRPHGHVLAYARRTRGRSVVLVGSRQVFAGVGTFNSLVWSPDGRWLAIGWPTADQLVFVRVGARPKLDAVSNVAEQFLSASFPKLAGWSR